MRYAAHGTPGVTVREAFVRRLINAAGEEWQDGQVVTGVSYKSGDAIRTAHAHLTIVCDGMYSTFRSKLADAPPIKHPSFFVGLLLDNIALPHPNHGHVVLAKPSPILFYPISSDQARPPSPFPPHSLLPPPLLPSTACAQRWPPPPTASPAHISPRRPPPLSRPPREQVRCLVDVPGEKLPADLPGYLRSNVAPEVPESLRAAFLAAVDGGRIRTMQNKQLPAKPMHQPGALLLGDAFNMRHPLTGGGMTVALSDCNLLCGLLQPLPSFQDAIATATSTAEFYTRRKPLSATINTLANALYKARARLRATATAAAAAAARVSGAGPLEG